MSPRLFHLGNVVIDLVLRVKDIPVRGGDILAQDRLLTPGGGFNVMASAVRQDLATIYGGVLGVGPFASLAKQALLQQGITIAHAPVANRDTGLVVCLIDATGERTFVTSPGAESHLTLDHLQHLSPTFPDIVYISGYSLVYPCNRTALLTWLDTLSPTVMTVFDPGPLVAEIPRPALQKVLTRSDWVTCNVDEAAFLTGASDGLRQAQVLASLTERHQVLVRAGRDGCYIAGPTTQAQQIPGFAVAAVDTNGAGDAHSGAFMAALAKGADASLAARWANAVAALAATRFGPATAPTTAEVAAWLGWSPP
ncbi:MAG: sugar kinase [Sulfobacillus acidophilus]|uniref:Sugar kinase n=1 Tax=Sulfobacillus acidophilus TaxID=53633 RepID=A0A2T2WFU8_9FIRM|nr:MAG: sugar kinase [Sulfobacillus acidophilus]